MAPGFGPRERGALLAGRAAGQVVRRLGRGGGTALPGLIAGRLAPTLIESAAAQLGHGVVTVTGTNGKTTTAHLLAAIARGAGLRPLANRSGSNLERGIVSSLVDAVDPGGSVHDAARRLGVFEIDEAHWPLLAPRLRPRVALFLNLFRDQLDRYGEVDSIAAAWRAAVSRPGAVPTLVLNVDDPSVAQLGEDTRGEVIGFGIEDPAAALPAPEHATDARFCRCGATYEYDSIYMGHVGLWRCRGCERRRPAPTVSAERVHLGAEETQFDLVIGERRVPVAIPLAGLYSVYNALAAAAGAHALGLPIEATARALADSGPAFGRQERFHVEGRTVRLLLAKNPTGLNEVLRALEAAWPPLTLLAMLNDGIQDGRDVSWIYDADVERLAGLVGKLVVSGRRAEDLALRFALAGIEPAAVDTDTRVALQTALLATPPGGRLEVVATYTAMLEVRELLASMSGAGHYWEHDE
ncbi:MAG TPA: MurT ligase domain-containing protein [Dehalococcoidia bacterium]|nr:MurT ligase domain-containing protein [Dehalococcoidia bacterium]